jgi:hypothetical protein
MSRILSDTTRRYREIEFRGEPGCIRPGSEVDALVAVDRSETTTGQLETAAGATATVGAGDGIRDMDLQTPTLDPRTHTQSAGSCTRLDSMPDGVFHEWLQE